MVGSYKNKQVVEKIAEYIVTIIDKQVPEKVPIWQYIVWKQNTPQENR